jgi:hypothetical protein
VQRPTTSGRRHDRAGAITVAELIKKQPSPIRIPSSEQAATEGFVEDLLGPEAPAEQNRPKASRAAKAAGLITGAVVLFASVATASVLAGNRPAGPSSPRNEPPLEISGVSALRPDLLNAQLHDQAVPPQVTITVASATSSRAPAASTAPTASANTSANTPAVTADARAEVLSQTEATVPSIATGPQPQIDVVRTFYELLSTSPTAASTLLAPELLGTDPHEFAQSWTTIKKINLDDTTLRPDGSVLAVVSMQGSDGRWLRVEQLFTLTDSSVPRIVGTQLVSAQRY